MHLEETVPLDETMPWGDDAERVRLITGRRPGVRRRMVLDTDTYNEIDDQFALVHALLAPDRAQLEAVYAAPFHNERSDGPADGMRKSFQEIRRVTELVGRAGTPVFEGAQEWLTVSGAPQHSDSTRDLIERALGRDERPLYVVAIGAPTNIASALMLAPEIVHRIVVVWLGGNALHWPSADEFNLRQDLQASQVLFDSGVALVHVPCLNVADHLITTREEVERYVRPCGAVGDFLAERYAGFVEGGIGVSKVIWDLGAVGWVLDPSWLTVHLTHSPILTNEMTWSRDPGRHLIAGATAVRRDAIFGDLFRRLASLSRAAK
jgi:purine nucleosidase